MGRIQSNVGLITGIPITDTVDQLIGVAGQSRDLLTTRTQGLQQEQVAVNTLASRVLSLKFDLDRLGVSDPFQSRTVTSGDEASITAILNDNGKPPLGSFSLRPAQSAASQQLISQRFESLDDIENVGSLSFGFGGFVDKGISLEALNDGAGVERGEIKITDLGGNSAVIDLSLARTVDDVITAINNESSINVTVSTDGDSFTLVDNIGGSGTLSVQEINGGSTAADLGIANLTSTTQSEVVAGTDVYSLHEGTKLASLNDGNGVRFTDDTADLDINDLQFTFADDSLDTDDVKFGVDLSGATTLGDVVDAINNDEVLASKVEAKISADGNRLELTDLTSGAGAFSVDNGTTGSAADDLGIRTTADGVALVGERLTSGLRDTLTASLNGGQGLGELGSIDITDRLGVTDSVDLSTAETLDEIVDLINASSAGVTAAVNDARSGLVLTDTSGGTGDFIIADNVGDGLGTATALGLAVNAQQDSVDTGSLNRQTISEATLLSSLNGGEGITASDIRIFTSNDESSSGESIDLNTSGKEAETIGDVIDAINAKDIGVEARINDKGDGILLTDNSIGNGDETFRIEDVNGTLAADLNLTAASKTIEIDGEESLVIDGSSSFTVDLSEAASTSSTIAFSSLNDGSGINRGDILITDSKGAVTALDLNGGDSDITTIGGLIDAINSRNADVTASINESGTGIQLTDNAGGDGTLVVEDVNGSAASDLNILSRDSTTTSINGSGLFTSQSESEGALANVATQINNLEAGVTATVLNDGQGFRLQLVVNKTGAANEILLDSGNSGFEFRETSSARDALLVVGAGATAGSGVLVSSSTNEFDDVIDGVDLTAISTSETAIDVSVTESDQEIVDLVQGFVDSYNSLRDDLDELTAFDADTLSTGLLFGTSQALRVDTDLSRLITDRYNGLGEFSSLQEIGISVDENGKLELDTAKLKDAFAEDATSLQTLFIAEDNGIVAKFNSAIDRLTDPDSGLLTNRGDSLQATIEQNEARIEQFNESLERQRERLLLEFFQLEQLISELQTSQQAVGSFQSVEPLAI